MNELTFSRQAFAEYQYWQKQDKKFIKKINKLLEDILRNGAANGLGKPERLKYREVYSRRIDEANRLVYEIDALQNIHILSCRGHYEE